MNAVVVALRRLRVVAAILLFAATADVRAAVDIAWLDDAKAVEGFVDGVVASQIASGRVVGATVTIVRDGGLVLSKGYGEANRDTGKRVATDTMFRVGSVSKVFVWVAVMQQVAAGRLDLNADINTYLKDLQIPETFPEPITLTHLMTHTAGFEDKPIIGLFARGPLSVGDFHENLQTMMPRRVWMPGRHAAYSNYGAALAARIVEVVSGENWDDYVDAHILKPLLMIDTTTRQPVPKALEDLVANGYWWKNGRHVDAPFEFLTLPPAGSVSSSGVDMGRFMAELLARGDTPVMAATTRALLFQPGYQHDPRLNRMRLGLYEQNSHGQTLIGHNGDTLAFHSILMLCPELNLGVFASFNNERAEKARDELIEAFLDRLFGVPVPQPKAAQSVQLERYRGFYTSMRAPVSGHDKVQSLLQTFEVSVDGDGTLLMHTDEGPQRFVKVDNDLFEREDGRERLAFAGEGAAPTSLFINSLPPIDMVRVDETLSPPAQAAFLIAVLVLCASVWLLWPISWLTHRGRVAVTGETRASLLAALTSAAIIGFCFVIAQAVSGPHDIVFGMPEPFKQALWVPMALIPLLLLQLVYTYGAWVGSLWWVSRRIHYTLLTFAAIAFVVWTFYWHLTAVIVEV
jgi:CubicO group peptidase (beta-lactamase class C family)